MDWSPIDPRRATWSKPDASKCARCAWESLPEEEKYALLNTNSGILRLATDRVTRLDVQRYMAWVQSVLAHDGTKVMSVNFYADVFLAADAAVDGRPLGGATLDAKRLRALKEGSVLKSIVQYQRQLLRGSPNANEPWLQDSS